MIRYLIRCFFLLCVCTFLQNVVDGQSPQSSYDMLKQRLLVAGTGNFIYNESQGQIDRDSANLFACRMYGYNRLLPYNEGFSDGVISPTSKLIDAGKIEVITNLLNYTEGLNKMRILLELGAYYLFKPGSQKKDMDSAWLFIQQANALSVEPASNIWQSECLSLLGKYYYQAGNMAESQKCFSKVVDVAGADPTSLAPAYENQGKYLPDQDPKKISYLERSLELYRKLQMKEKEIEVRMYIADANHSLAEKQWQQILILQRAIGFRHTLYTEYALSYLADQKNALSYARQALDNMQETGDSALACLFYTRMGTVYSHLNKPEEALAWYQKSYAGKKNSATQDLWYKGFISAANLLAFLGRAEEALSLMQEITAGFPPSSAFDKMRLAFIKGYSYERLKDNTLAAVNYDTFTSMADQFHYTETPEAFYQVSLFYFNQGQTAKARTYLQKALDYTSGSMGIQNLAGIHLLFSKLDSASGRYASALQYRIKYAFYRDSLLSDQMQELRAKYETEKKDQHIQLITQSGKLQQAALQQSGFLRNIILGGLVALLIIAGLLYWLKRVTNKKNTDLQHLAHEKDWLLKEAHYRVKNNLQTILSLLESQSSVQDSQNRIYATSLIHRRSENTAAVDIRSYLPELVNHLRESFDVSRQIHIHLNIPPLELDVSQAVPVTLIINEAISNSIKYAFPRKEIGQEITVCMEQGTDHEITLTISDNGIGVLPDLDSHLGLKLMDGLVDDINGTFAIRSAEGTTISIHFMANAPLHKVRHAV
jgi:two-component sensor histidine kinase